MSSTQSSKGPESDGSVRAAMSPVPGAFSVGRHDHDGRSVFVPRGELDLATVPALEEPVLAALDEGQHVVIDLRELAFMDSSGVRVLIAAHRLAGDAGERLALVRPRDGGTVARILEIAGVGQALRMVDGLEPPDR
jgi:anti-sigma B factor antagonist